MPAAAGQPGARKAALRRRVLRLTALVFSLVASAALFNPDRVAASVGWFLNGVNGYSQFYAMYVGVGLATAGLALMAARHGEAPLLGDVTAMFVLAQPAGRLLAAALIGLPQGLVLVMCGAELLCGILLLALRPAPR